MQKCLKRLLSLRIITCVFYSACIIAIIQLFTFGEYNYHHIPPGIILTQIYKKTNPNLVKKANIECSYDEVLSNTRTVNTWEVYRTNDDFSPKGIVNGSFVPEHCNPTVSVAILVTYRNRQQQLDLFLPYMHNFLRRQNIHYKIFLIEQQDEKPWNKGLLYNIGARAAIAEQFPCLVLHDVDLLPLDAANLYACMASPRHLSASLDKFRYVLLYDTLVGGVLAIRTDHFLAVDGFSNRFEGWGGEDDDFANRMIAAKLDIIRFPRQMSRYTMLRHAPATPNSARYRIRDENMVQPGPGYKAARYSALSVKHHRLFMMIGVKL